MLSPVSTWMGDRLGTRGAVGKQPFDFCCQIQPILRWKMTNGKPILFVWYGGSRFWLIKPFLLLLSCLRPYHIEHTSSRPITEVKQCWARLVLGWVTAWEHWVLLASFSFLIISFFLLLSTLNFHRIIVRKKRLQLIFLVNSIQYLVANSGF